MLLGQRISHMAPERRRRIRDPSGELLVGAGDACPKVKAGNSVPQPSLAGVGNLTKDAGEAAQAVLPTLECIRRRHELTGQTSS